MTGTATRNRGGALHPFEHVLVEPGFARRDLQIGLAGDAVYRLREGGKHALVRGVHADEHGDTEHDPGHGERRPEHVLPRVRPADQFQEPHRVTSSTMRPSRSARVRSQLSATWSRA